jgi:hypothetical protein
MATSGNSKVIFMPFETSAVLSSVGTLREVFGQTGENSSERRDSGDPPSALPAGRMQR